MFINLIILYIDNIFYKHSYRAKKKPTITDIFLTNSIQNLFNQIFLFIHLQKHFSDITFLNII